MDSFIIALIGGAAGSIITFVGTLLKPWVDYKWEKRKDKEKMKLREDRLRYILRPTYDALGNAAYPTYELSMLSAAVGLNVEECMNLLIKINAWGRKEGAETVWALHHNVLFRSEEHQLNFTLDLG